MVKLPQDVTNQKDTVILFGGQGSSSLFSKAAAAAAEDNSRSCVAAATLASQCHAAFLEEYRSLSPHEQHSIGIDLDRLHSHHDFLVPPREYHRNGLVQSTTICLYQLLQYVAMVDRSTPEDDCLSEQILETTGFCSGLIPAAVVASSQTSVDLINWGREAFRLAFWIAGRSILEGDALVETLTEDETWSLIVLGLTRLQVEDHLQLFYLQTELRSLRISAISSSTAISLSGRPSDISSFRGYLGPAVVTKVLHVNAWYHGGEQLEDVVSQVMRDIDDRHINFPSFIDLRTALRSTLDGLAIHTEGLEGNTLARWVIQHILETPVDWTMVSRGIVSSMQQVLESSPTLHFKVLSFGPSSNSLIAELSDASLSSNLEVIDVSPFKFDKFHSTSINPDDIAIVGMGVDYPKGKGQEELWATISKGLSAVSEIPRSRFDISQYHSTEKDRKSRTMPTMHGAFLDDIWGFDNSYFNISPREAKSMDPQQRILLTTTQRALEDAGYVSDATPSFRKASMGCYIGLATGDYTDNLREDIDVFYSPGRGTQMYLGLSCGHFLNETGGCKPFDATADGYCRAEGCGVFILKRLSDAVAEDDRIHGVIKAVEINQSGNSSSITQPHSETQAELFRRVLQKSRVDPSTVSVVEAHGTGTQAGDKKEIESLRTVFGDSHSASNPLVVSSVKGNIGHSEAASGAAGLAKLLLMFRKNEIPAQAGFAELNPCFADITGTGIMIPRQSEMWKHSSSRPKRALLNNFGAAGSNVALLLEDFRHVGSRDQEFDDRSTYVFNVSAKDRQALEISVKQNREFLSTLSERTSLRDICYTMSARRQVYSHRLSISCSSIPDLCTKLEKIDVTTVKPAQIAKALVFVFSGQGATHYGMGEELMKTAPLFRRTIMECNGIIQKLGLPSMLEMFQSSKDPCSSSGLESQVATSQCACVSLEYALAKLFISWNVKPDYVVGHSLGEYAALAIAGALSLENALYIVARRAQLMTSNCPLNQSGMVTCNASGSTAENIIATHDKLSQLSVACKNSPGDCVVAGPLDVLVDFAGICSKLNIKTKKLSVSHGFHSSAMDPIVKPLQELGRSIAWSTPSIPVASNVHGRFFSVQDFQGSYFALHARKPVQFEETIRALQAQGIFDGAMCREIGPHPITLPMLRKNLLGSSRTFVPTLQRDLQAWTTTSAALNQIFLTADDTDWREVFNGSGARMANTPGYPLNPSSFGIPYQEKSCSIVSQELDSNPFQETGLRLLPWLLTSKSGENTLVFETSTKILGPLISGHNVGGICICPASLFHEIVLEAAQVGFVPSESQVLTVYNMAFPKPLIYGPADGPRPVHVKICKIKPVFNTGDIAEIEVIISTIGKETQRTLCCSAVAAVRVKQELEKRLVKDAAIVKRQSRHLLNSNSLNNTFRTKLLYETIFTRVVSYSSEYQTLKMLSVSESDLEGIGIFQMPSSSNTDGYITPPVFTDTLLHAAGFVANLTISPEEICICGHVESIEILYDRLDYSDPFTIYCSLVDIIKGTVLADAFAIDKAGMAVAVIRGMEFKRLRLQAFQRMLMHTGPVPKLETARTHVMRANIPEIEALDTPAFSGIGTATPSTSQDSHLDTKSTFVRIISEVYGSTERLDMDQSLEHLGIDSLMQIEITAKLNQAFPRCPIDYDLLFKCETLQALQDNLVSMIDTEHGKTEPRPPIKAPNESPAIPTSTFARGAIDEAMVRLADGAPESKALEPTSTNPTILHTATGPQTPLCLIHDGSGQSSMYRQIRFPDRNVIGFHDPDFFRPSLQTSSIEQMASRYIAALSPSETPCLILGGWSFGGVVAYEAARQLSVSGVHVRGLLLIDSSLPRDHESLPEEIITHTISGISSSPNPNLLREFKHCARMLSQYNPPAFSSQQQSSIKTVMLQSAETFDTHGLCGVEYGWLARQDVRDQAIEGWKDLVGANMVVLPIEGNHFEVFARDKIEDNSAQIMQACRLIDGSVGESVITKPAVRI